MMSSHYTYKVQTVILLLTQDSHYLQCEYSATTSTRLGGHLKMPDYLTMKQRLLPQCDVAIFRNSNAAWQLNIQVRPPAQTKLLWVLATGVICIQQLQLSTTEPRCGNPVTLTQLLCMELAAPLHGAGLQSAVYKQPALAMLLGSLMVVAMATDDIQFAHNLITSHA